MNPRPLGPEPSALPAALHPDKPFNYKGILCLESTIAWGLYTVILFVVLHGFVERLVDFIPVPMGKGAGLIIVIAYLLDFGMTFYHKRQESNDLTQ